MTGEKKHTTPAEKQPQKSSTGKGNKTGFITAVCLSVSVREAWPLCFSLGEGGVAFVS